MNVRPLQDRLLVRRVEEETKTAGGLFIPDSAKERPLEGNVISVGAGKRLEYGTLIELDVKPGDEIVLSVMEHHSNLAGARDRCGNQWLLPWLELYISRGQ